MRRVALSTPGEHLHTLLLGNSESYSSEDKCQCLSYRFLHNTLLDLCVFNAKECLICDCHLDNRVQAGYRNFSRSKFNYHSLQEIHDTRIFKLLINLIATWHFNIIVIRFTIKLCKMHHNVQTSMHHIIQTAQIKL